MREGTGKKHRRKRKYKQTKKSKALLGLAGVFGVLAVSVAAVMVIYFVALPFFQKDSDVAENASSLGSSDEMTEVV